MCLQKRSVTHFHPIPRKLGTGSDTESRRGQRTGLLAVIADGVPRICFTAELAEDAERGRGLGGVRLFQARRLGVVFTAVGAESAKATERMRNGKVRQVGPAEYGGNGIL